MKTAPLPPTGEKLLNTLKKQGRQQIDLKTDRELLERISSKPRWLLSDLHRRGYAHPIQRGRYVIHDTPSLAPAIVSLDPLAALLLRRLDEPYYVSWHSALWHHGLIEQQSGELFVAVTFRKRPAQVGPLRIRFVTVRKRKFFDWSAVGSGEGTFSVASVEKALIDSFDRPALVGPFAIVAEALREAWQRKRLDAERLVADALRFDSPFVNRRLGLFMQEWGIPGWEELELRTGRSSAITLVPGGPAAGEVDARWRVYRDPFVIETARQRR